MSTQVQYRRGTATQNNAFIGALAEITVDTTNLTLRVHDGINAGGSNIATVAYVDNAIGSLSANSITDGTSNVRIVSTNGNVAVGVAGTSNVAVFASTGLRVVGSIEATNGFIGLDATAIANGSANVRTFANANVTVSAAGNANVLVVTGTGANIAGTVNATGNANVGNLGAATVVATTLTGTLSTAAQTNITSVGTLSSLTVTGNISGGNVSGTNLTGTLLTAAQTNITSVGTLTSLAVTGNISGGNVSGTNLTGTLLTAAQTNITSVGTLGALTVTGNITGGNLITAGLVSLSSITKTGSNGVGNIGAATSTFNTIFAKATSAQYADLAELYTADQEYTPGTVLVFGGTAEVTESTESHSARIAGVVSTEPAHIMNSGLTGEYTVAVALVGRVPCRVVGTIRRGDCLASSDIPGVATALDAAQYTPGAVIGKALEDYNSTEPGVIEAVVGRL